MFTARFQAWVRAGARRLVPVLQRVHLTAECADHRRTDDLCCVRRVGCQWYLLAGGIVLLVASLFDVLDGALARVAGKMYRYGAFLDSTIDRYAEAFTYIALLWYFLFRAHETSSRCS